MLTCQQLTEVITEYAEGRMPFWRRAEVWFHLLMCRHCRAYMRQMRATAQLLGHLPPQAVQDSLSPAMEAELMRRFRDLYPPSGDASASAPPTPAADPSPPHKA